MTASLIIYSVAAVAATILFVLLRHVVGGLFGLYRVVPVNEAHIRILKNTKTVYSSRTGVSAYWYIPFITKLHKLPLCNLAVPVMDIKLNDKNMAKFICDIMCFINISDINLAVERLSLTDVSEDMGFDFKKLSEDLRAIMESIGRTVTTKQTILDIYMDRKILDQAITNEVEGVFPKWGIQLVDLELKDIKDAEGSTIIADIERKVAADIRRDADIKVAIANKEAEVAKAESEEIFRKRQIEKDRTIGIAEAQKREEVARMQQTANASEVESKRSLDVGAAEIKKQEMQQLAEGQKIKLALESEGESSKIKSIGTAEAEIIKIKKLAEAEGTMKLAEAMKAFNDTAINVKILDTQKEILTAKFKAFSEALAKADIKWILSGDQAQKFFGLNLNAEGGAAMEQFLDNLDPEKVKQVLSKLMPKSEK